jgi:hypothetical protein
MKNGLQSASRIGIGKYPRAHGHPIERAIPIDHPGTERRPYRGQGRAAGCRQLSGDGIGIHHVGPQVGEYPGHRAFTRPDPTGQSQAESSRHQPNQR